MGLVEVWFPEQPEVPAETFDDLAELRTHLRDRHGIEFGPSCTADTLQAVHDEAHRVANTGPVRLKV